MTARSPPPSIARTAASTEKWAIGTEPETAARAASFGAPSWTNSTSSACAAKKPRASAAQVAQEKADGGNRPMERLSRAVPALGPSPARDDADTALLAPLSDRGAAPEDRSAGARLAAGATHALS